MGQEVLPVMGPGIQGIVHVPVDPCQEKSSQDLPDAGALIQKSGIAPEKDRDLFMKVFHAMQVTAEIPAVNQDGVRLPLLYLFVQGRIDESPEMPDTGIGGGVIDKTVFISFQQGKVPSDIFSEFMIVFFTVFRLLPCIEYM